MNKVFNYLFIAIFIFQFFVVLWGINKGFDLTDEGYIALLLKQERLSFGQLRKFEILLGRWLSGLNIDVLGFRLISMGLTLSSSTIFYFSFQKYIDKYLPNENKKIIPPAAFSLIGFLNFYQFARSTSIINYNIITNVNVVLAASFTFFSLAGNKNNPPDKNSLIQPWMAAIGFLMGIQYTAKQPVVIAFLLFMVLFIYFQGKQKTLVFFLFMAANVSIGFVLSSLLVCRTFGGTANSLESETIVNYLRLILMEYKQDLLSLLSFLLLALPALITGSAVVFIRLKDDHGRFAKYRKAALIALSVFFLASVGFLLYITNFSPLSNSTGKKVGIFFFIFSLFSTGIWVFKTYGESNASFAKTFEKGQLKREFIGLVIFLLLLPFLAGIGTSNSIFAQAARHILPWGALIILVYNSFLNETKLSAFASVTLVMVVIWLGVQFSYNYLFKPYRIIGNMFDQQYYFSKYVPRGKGIMVSEETKQTVDEISRALYSETDFTKGDPVIDLYVMPGITYLIGGQSPIGGWTNQSLRDRICSQLRNNEIQIQRVVILTNTEIVEDIKDCMFSVGIEMENDFVNITTTPYANQRNAKFSRIDVLVHENLIER